MGENEAGSVDSGNIKLIRDHWSGDYCCHQLGKEDRIRAAAPKSFSMQWLIEKDKPLKERREEKPDRPSDKKRAALEVKRRQGFKWVEWSAMLTPTEMTTDGKLSPEYRGVGITAGFSRSNVVERWGDLEKTKQGIQGTRRSQLHSSEKGRELVTGSGCGHRCCFGWGHCIFVLTREIFSKMIDTHWEGRDEYRKRRKHNH